MARCHPKLFEHTVHTLKKVSRPAPVAFAEHACGCQCQRGPGAGVTRRRSAVLTGLTVTAVTARAPCRVVSVAA